MAVIVNVDAVAAWESQLTAWLIERKFYRDVPVPAANDTLLVNIGLLLIKIIELVRKQELFLA